MLKHADLIVTARISSGLLIGVARSITDFHYCTYLSDLAVDVSFQRRGIGRRLIDFTHEEAGKKTTLILLAAQLAPISPRCQTLSFIQRRNRTTVREQSSGKEATDEHGWTIFPSDLASDLLTPAFYKENSMLSHSVLSRYNTMLVLCAGSLLAVIGRWASGPAHAQEKVQQESVAVELPVRPTQPSGYLGSLGQYHVIEGALHTANDKAPSNSLDVDTVDGQRLKKPLTIMVKNVRLPAKVRIVLKGYELGSMIGRPPAEYTLTRELGGDPNKLAMRDATAWRWEPYFVPLLVVQPTGLTAQTKWGLPKR